MAVRFYITERILDKANISLQRNFSVAVSQIEAKAKQANVRALVSSLVYDWNSVINTLRRFGKPLSTPKFLSLNEIILKRSACHLTEQSLKWYAVIGHTQATWMVL